MSSPGVPGSKSSEIKPQGLFGRQREPLFKQPNSKILAPVGAAILGVCFYWNFTYSGPYRYLAEWQLKWIGSYSPELTMLLIFAGVFAGVVAILSVIRVVFRGAERPVSETPVASIAAPTVMPAAMRGPALQPVDRWLQSIRLAVLYVTPLIILGLGAYFYYNATREGGLQKLTVADFESGQITARALYADVHGQLSDSYLVSENYRYIPVLAKEKSARPVRLLVGINDGDVLKYLHRESDGTFTVRGVADKGLSSDLKYAFEKNGIAVADPVWVVHAGRDPSGDRLTGLLIMGLGAVLGCFVVGWQSYLKRKAAVRPPQASA